jgi:initiation factor 1A
MSTANRNTRGGKAYKKTKSGNVRRRSKNPDMPVDTTTGIDHYGVVTRRLGDNRLIVKLDTGSEIQAVIPGRFRRRVWFNSGDYVQVQSVGDNFYDVIQKIVNENEQAKAQATIGKKEYTENDIFAPVIEESESESEPDSDEEFDAFGNKIESKKTESKETEKTTDIKLNKDSVNVSKYTRKLKEKERDISRRSNVRDYDLKPESIVDKNAVSDSDSETNSDSD